MTLKIIPFLFVILNLKSVEKKQKIKTQKFEYLENKMSFLDEIERMFYRF